jgi:hypothetical protein
MADRFKALEALKARGLEEVLDELHALKQRQRSGLPVRIPAVTLHLRSGRDVYGHVLEVAEDRRAGRVVLLHAPGPELRNPQTDAMYLAAASIEALTVHDVELQDRPVAAPGMPAPAAPTSLQLKRRFAELARTLGEPYGGEVPVELSGTPDAEGLSALSALADRLVEVMRKLAADELGREAVREKVRRIALAVSDGTSASLMGGTLTITTGKAPARWPTTAELEQSVQSVL